METNTAFVWADGVIVLHTVAHIVVDPAFVIHPRYAEGEYTVGNAEALDKVDAFILRMPVIYILDCRQDFLYCLMVFRLIGEPTLQVG